MFISKELRIDLNKFIARNFNTWIEDAKGLSRYSEDDFEGLQLTFSFDDAGESFGWQSGDNSFTGGAYGLPNWAVVWLYPDDDLSDFRARLMSEIDQLEARNIPSGVTNDVAHNTFHKRV